MTIRRKLSIGISILLVLFSSLGVVVYYHIGQIDENISEIIHGKELGKRVALLYRQYKVLDEILKQNKESRSVIAATAVDNLDAIEEIITNEMQSGFDLNYPQNQRFFDTASQMKLDISRISKEFAFNLYSSNNNYNNSIMENAGIFEDKIKLLHVSNLTEAQNKSLDKIQSIFDETLPLVQKTFALNEYIKEKQADYTEKKDKIDSLLGKEYEVFTETDLKNAKIEGRKIVGTAVIVILILVLTGILDVFVFSAAITRSITKPIVELKNAMAKIGQGNFETKINLNTADEIGQLAACFNDMTGKLKQTTTSIEKLNTEIAKRKEAQSELQKAHNELEHRVEERTVELAQANKVLEVKNEQYSKAVCALRDSENRLNIILNSILAGVVVIDTETKKIVDVNPLAAELIGLTKDEIVGNICHEFICPAYQGKCPITDLGQCVDHAERILLNANKESIAIYKTVTPVKWNDHEYLVESFVDISARKKAQQELEKLNKDLDLAVQDLSRSNKELQEFAYVVAHDLKTPLRGIISLADWIANDYADKLDEQGKEQLEMLQSRAKQTGMMVNDILEYSKLGRKQGEKIQVDLNILINDIISGIDSGENIEIIVTDQFPTITCDRTQILQVFQNLITNAVKYMDKPHGKIQIGCCDREDFWQFSVSDNGPGIEKNYFEKIFKMFQTLSKQDRQDSTGIGLSIVKKIVELNQGKVWLESEPGNGCTFFFTFPKQKCECLV